MAQPAARKKGGVTAAPPPSPNGNGSKRRLSLAQPSKAAAVKKAAASKSPSKKFAASISPGVGQELPAHFVSAIQALENNLGMPVWMLLQTGSGQFGEIDEHVRRAFFASKDKLPAGKPVALVLDSPGGYAKSAYQIATILRRHCGSFTVVVPRYAKSAATLVTLGADTILLGTYGELGPLDAQLLDFDREQMASALDEVQTLERLHAFALDAVDQTMMLLINRTGKKLDILLPATLRYVSDMMRPMFEKVDVVHYTQLARILKVAEEYAIRLLRPRYSKDEAERIARHLVERYPEHGFIIDAEEASNPELGLKTKEPSDEQARIMDRIIPFLGRVNIIGRLQEVPQP